jgi:FkbM family methyltransferase
MNTREIKLINGRVINIELNTQSLENHFNIPSNCTIEILRQFNDQNYYEKFIDKNDKIILDLGANIGLFAIHVSPWAEKIYCLEPTANHFNLLTLLTSKYSNIDRTQAAISNKTGKEIFHISNSNSTTNSLFNRDGISVEVDSFSISDFAKLKGLEKIDFIKMDIEGSELIVLDSDTINFISSHVSKILIEFHINIQESINQFISIFNSFGYITEQFAHDAIFCKK